MTAPLKPRASASGPAPDGNGRWLARSLAAVWHPCTQMKHHETLPLVPVARAAGPWLYDFEGRRYLDAVSSWWVNLWGHGHPAIVAAIREQLDSLDHVMLAGFTHAPAVELAERLAALAPAGLGHCFYASDGASAVEIALKMSAHYWRNQGRPGKVHFVSVEGGYHGETALALSVTDIPLFRAAYGPLLRPNVLVPSPDWRLAKPGESAESFAERRAADLDWYLEGRREDVAAVIVEPLVQCARGMAMHHPAYLTRLREICDRHEVHLIADEIAVGFGRTGTLFACEQAGIRPDFLCLSKGLSAGALPLSAVLTTEAVYQAFYDEDLGRGFLHSHSFTGNPLACRAALASLDLFESTGALAENRRKAARLTELARPIAHHPKVAEFRNTGMIWAFDLPGAPAGFARDFATRALAEGLLLRPIGNSVYFMPPYVITEEEMRFLVDGTLRLIEATPDVRG